MVSAVAKISVKFSGRRTAIPKNGSIFQKNVISYFLTLLSIKYCEICKDWEHFVGNTYTHPKCVCQYRKLFAKSKYLLKIGKFLRSAKGVTNRLYMLVLTQKF